MKHFLISMFLLGALAAPGICAAQHSQDFGDYVVHYNAFNTNLIPPQVATSYGITRSSSRALLNVTVLKKVLDTPGTPTSAVVTANATNLSGQLREISMREVKDSEGAVYYLGEFPIHHLETYRFEISVTVEEEKQPLMVRFKQEFFTE